MADGRTTEWSYDDVGRLVQEHFKSAGPSPTTLLRYIYAYDAAGNRTSKKTDYDDNDGNGYAATATYTNNGYNQLTAVSGSPGRGTRVNVTGTIPTAWTLADGDVTVTPNEGDPVPAEVRGRFFVARNVPLQDGDNALVASTSATTLAGNEPTSDTVEDVELDTSLDQEYTYNANGDLIQKTEDVNGTTIQWDYTYSVDGWLTKVEKEVGGQSVLVEEYWYDPVGRKYKISTTENQQTTTRYFVHDGSSIVVELEKDGDYYLLEKEHVRGPSLGGGIGGLLYTRDAEGTTGYFHYDGRGNVVSVTNEAREEIAYYEYDAWGNILTACGSLANEFAFSTKQASLSTGLIDFGYRWYDPSAGRWTQRDPIGYSDGVNLYHYLGGSAPNRIDPSGLEFWDAHGNPNGGPGPNDSYGQTVTYTTDNNPAESGGGPGSSRFWGIVGILCKRQWDRLTDPDQWLWPKSLVIDPNDPCCGPDPTWEQIKQIWNEDPLAAVGTAILEYTGASGVYELTTGRDFYDGHRLTDEEYADAAEKTTVFVATVYTLASGGGGRKPRCFAEGTEVACEDGWRPIEELEAGDLVWACDPETGEVALARVSKVFVGFASYLTVLTVGGEQIANTPQHRFWVVEKGWTTADDLKVGDRLRGFDGRAIPIESIDSRTGSFKVYNLEVERKRTYFVSSKKILVHNKKKWKGRIPDGDPVDNFIGIQKVQRAWRKRGLRHKVESIGKSTQKLKQHLKRVARGE